MRKDEVFFIKRFTDFEKDGVASFGVRYPDGFGGTVEVSYTENDDAVLYQQAYVKAVQVWTDISRSRLTSSLIQRGIKEDLAVASAKGVPVGDLITLSTDTLVAKVIEEIKDLL